MKPMVPSAWNRAEILRHSVSMTEKARVIEAAYRDGHAAGFAAALAMLREPSDEIVKKFSRLHHPGAWAKIDKNIDDDDWNGGTALNLGHALLRDAPAALLAAASALADIAEKEGEE